MFILSAVLLVFATVFSVKLLMSDKMSVLPVRPAKKVYPEEANVSGDFAIKKLKNVKKPENVVADEFRLSWDLVDPLFAKIIIYSLTYEKRDKFEYSCIKQVLDEHNISYTFKETNDTYDVYISLEQKLKALKIYEILRTYDINGTYKETFQVKENLYDEK